MKDGSASKLEIILGLSKKASTHVIALGPEREMRIPAVIRAATYLHAVRIAAAGGGLWLQVGPAKNRMYPWFPTPLAPCGLWACPVKSYFYVVGADSGRRERRCDVSFNSQPFVKEIGDRSLYTDGVRIDHR